MALYSRIKTKTTRRQFFQVNNASGEGEFRENGIGGVYKDWYVILRT
jgi:hypothetical protein